jgi:hypothetical protein
MLLDHPRPVLRLVLAQLVDLKSAQRLLTRTLRSPRYRQTVSHRDYSEVFVSHEARFGVRY